MTDARYQIEICDGNSCHVRKSKKIIKAVWAKLGLSEEKTVTDDGMLSIIAAGCFEICGPGPLMKINGEIYEHVTPESALDIIKNLK